MRKLVLATRNPGKIREFQRLLSEYASDIEVLGLNEFPDMPDVEETGDSFEANSLLKASAVAEFTKLPAIADDSGLCVDALNGDPGIFSARYAGEHGNDSANNEKLLRELKNEMNRNAQFKCVITMVIPTHSGSEVLVEEGSIAGTIVDEVRGESGFGYDPLFKPIGSDLTFAEFPHGEKDEISHRGQALRKIAPRITKVL
jgi:XTP/dITP diphosphohydrolase